MFFRGEVQNVGKLPLGGVPLQGGQIALDWAIWPSPQLIVRNYAKKVVFFMLFDHSEAENGPRGCRKMPKKSFELDLSKEALISKNG